MCNNSILTNKTLLRVIKERNQMERNTMVVDSNWSIHQFWCIFVIINKQILKHISKYKAFLPRIATTIFKKNKVGGHMLPDFKTH